MERVLAIDPGFERLGVAVLEKQHGKEVLLYSSCIITSAHDPFPKRLAHIGKEISALIASWQPSSCALETLLFNSNQKTAMRVAEARGVVVYLAAAHEITTYEYTPSQIKIAVTGYGKAPKTQVETMVRSLVQVDKKVALDDEMDAIAVGLTHLASVR